MSADEKDLEQARALGLLPAIERRQLDADEERQLQERVGEMQRRVAAAEAEVDPRLRADRQLEHFLDEAAAHRPRRRTYLVNEIFLAPQGEGLRAGELSVFLRLSKCNMRCDLEPGPRSPGGFACDTEFESGRPMTAEEIVEECERLWPSRTETRAATFPGEAGAVDGKVTETWYRGEPWVVVTGGEPALQLDVELCDALHGSRFSIAVETNGSMLLPLSKELPSNPDELSVDYVLEHFAVDWITVSPKVAEHAVRQRWAHEVKYVRGRGQAVPQPSCRALHQLLSPATNGLEFDDGAVDACLRLVRENPEWRMTAQLHKLWRSR